MELRHAATEHSEMPSGLSIMESKLSPVTLIWANSNIKNCTQLVYNTIKRGCLYLNIYRHDSFINNLTSPWIRLKFSTVEQF